MDTHIFTNSLNSIYLLHNHTKSPSFQSNHHDKLLIAYIINTIKNSHHRFTIQKVRAHTNITGNEEVDNFAKQGVDTPHIISTPFHIIGHQTPYWPSIPPTSTQQDGSICNLTRYIEKELVSAIVSQTTSTLSHASKRGSNTDLHFKWSIYYGTPHGIQMHKLHRFLQSVMINILVTIVENTSSNKTYPPMQPMPVLPE
jgi:hypothetical protein